MVRVQKHKLTAVYPQFRDLSKLARHKQCSRTSYRLLLGLHCATVPGFNLGLTSSPFKY